MENEHINKYYEDANDLYNYLIDNKQTGYATYINEICKKYLVLSAASYFESRISESITNYARRCCGKDNRIVGLVEKKVVKRQYHTLFDWDSKNTNIFWSLLGKETRDHVRKKIDNNLDLADRERCFIEIGAKRNKLVHDNFALSIVNDSAKDIYEKYKGACKFLALVDEVLNPEYSLKLC